MWQFDEALSAFKDTLLALGQRGPSFFWTDKPMCDWLYFVRALPSLADKFYALCGTLAAARDDVGVFDRVPPGLQPFDDCGALRRLSVMSVKGARERFITIHNTIVDAKAAGFTAVASIDAEWCYGETRGVRIFQLAYRNSDGEICVDIFQCREKAAPADKKALQLLLMDDDITFVGRGVKEDLRRVNTTVFQGACFRNVSKVNAVDLGLFARKRDVVDTGAAGLQRLTACALSEHLPKPAEDRGSDGSAANLSDAQKRYAALDVVAGVRVYLHLGTLPDLSERVRKTSVHVGMAVDLAPEAGLHGVGVCALNTVVATGKVVQVRGDWDAPDFVAVGGRRERRKITPAKIPLKGVKRRVVVEVRAADVQAPGFCVSGLTLAPKDSARAGAVEQVTVGHLSTAAEKNDGGDSVFTVPVPLKSLRQHVEGAHVRVFAPTPNAEAAMRDAARDSADTQYRRERGAEERVNEGDDEEDVPYEVEMARGGSERAKQRVELRRAAEFAQGRGDMEWGADKRVKLSAVPVDIVDKFHCVLGDAFHYMDRPYVPVHHTFKKVCLLRAAVIVRH